MIWIKKKKQMEIALIEKLLKDPKDTLIIETLAYMKSESAVPELKNILEQTRNHFDKIVVAEAIYKISQDKKMADVALGSFKKLNEKFDLISIFHHLQIFHDERIDNEIKRFINHKDFLISYNAKRYWI